MMVLEAGLKATTLTPSAAEAEFAALSKLSRDRILAMFRVPPRLLGIMDEAAGADKGPDYQRVFDNKAVKPFLNKLQRKISMGVTQLWDCDFVIDHRYTMPKEDQVKLAGDFASIPGITVREVREFLDLPPTGDPNIDDLVLNLPGDDGDPDNTRDGFPDRPLPGEPGRPPQGENTTAFGVVGGGNRPDLVPGSRARRPSEKALTVEQILERLERKAVTLESQARTGVGSRLPAERRPDDTLAQIRETEVDQIVAPLTDELQRAARVLERGLLDHVEGKAFRPNDLVRRVRSSESWKTFNDMLADSLESHAKRALSSAVVQNSSLVEPKEEIDYDTAAREIVYRPEGAKAITKTLREQVLKDLAEAIVADKSQEEVNVVVRDRLRNWQESQAATVALTEMTHAYNEGTLLVAEAAGVTHVMVSDGNDHDEPCQEANGSLWTIEQARENRLEHPRCRRAFVPLVSEQ